jgi:CheY-like chemotaxis protein
LDTNHETNFLIVENDPNDAFLIHRALAMAKCGASFVCRNPSEAKSYLRGAGMYADRRQFPFPGVLLTDLRMGAESGIELVAWIREQEPPIRDLKVIILTGSASELQWDAAMKVGAQQVHRKPTRLEDLQDLMTNIATEFCPGPRAREGAQQEK